MILTLKERMTLLNILPPQGDFTTLKLLREYRESLSTNDEERALFSPQYKCPKCGDEGVFAGVVKCAKCDVYMLPTGSITCRDWGLEKDILIGKVAMEITTETLKQMEETAKRLQGNPNPPQGIKMLTNEHFSLYEKFVAPEETKKTTEE